MVQLDTLNELPQLRRTGFGQPAPRHGLNLLYWFAHKCMSIDYHGNLVPTVNPENGDFGFHEFKNRLEDDYDHLLPVRPLKSYEVGNLNARKAEHLPQYVKEDYSGQISDSNKDRIIVYVNQAGNFERVYVTEHNSRSGFDHSRTYRISQGLLKIIRSMKREQFIQQMQCFNSRLQSYTGPVFTEQSYCRSYSPPPPPPPENQSWCTIL